jgi:hypothetical protein
MLPKPDKPSEPSDKAAEVVENLEKDLPRFLLL